jgi:hypothetical protein
VLAFESTADIDAPPEEVWPILADAGAWPEWDSGVKSVEGPVEPGSKLKLTTTADPDRAWPIKVAELDPPNRMVWRSGMPLGLFKGERIYRLEPAAGGTRFHMREQFTGPLAPLIGRSIPDLQPAFEQFAAGLKARAERPSARTP